MPFRPTLRQREAIQLLKRPARYILLQGGSRSGKTTLIVYWCLHVCLKYPGARVLIARLHLSDLKISIINDTLPKVAYLMSENLGKYVESNYNKNENVLKFPNGSQLWLGGLSDKHRTEKILGTEFCFIYLAEITQIGYESFEMLCTRLAQKVGMRNRFAVDCNPAAKSHWGYWLFMKHQDPVDKTDKNADQYATLIMNPYDNPHLPEDYVESMSNYSLRNQQRFLRGEWLDDIEGALWKQELIDRNRVNVKDVINFERIVLGIDPAVTADKRSSNETGLIVVGLTNKKGYVIADASGVYTPDGWGQKAVYLYNYYNIDMIICETNQGGDLVVSNITHIDKRVRIKKIHAKRGKVLRADPIVGLYERDEVKHLGHFKQLEEQMCTWVPDQGKDSPDRIDALVYALQELMAPPQIPSIHRVR